MNGNILVDNMTNRFDLYSTSRTAPSRSFVVPTTKIFAKKGVFGEKGNSIVTGSDHGKVYVFAVNKKESMQKLEHGSEKLMIQAVEVKFSIFLKYTWCNVAYFFRQLWQPITISFAADLRRATLAYVFGRNRYDILLQLMISLTVKQRKVQYTQNGPTNQGNISSLALIIFFNAIFIALCWSSNIWAPSLQVVGRLDIICP